MSTPIYYIKNGELSFGDKVIFESAELYLYPNDKICLIGRNGSGKSSLLKVITGKYELSAGESYTAPNIRVSYLNQSYQVTKKQNLYQFILGEKFEEIKYKADIILAEFEIDGNKQMDELSGGQLKRACLAKTLIDSPELILLDEPTNHLDIKLIEKLEQFIQSYQGCVVCISHDRSFLSNVTNKVWWLDKGVIRKSDQGFRYFEKWQEEVIEQETRELQKLNKKLKVENDWLAHGVTARRKRNQQRLTQLFYLREKLRNQQTNVNNTRQKIQTYLEEAKKTKFIIEADNISYAYGTQKLISNFSFRVKKGEKIGIIGPNGTGKTTLLKLLTKELAPLTGKVKHGTELNISYLEQTKNSLKPELTIHELLCPGGSFYLEIGDRVIHAASYLKQFMFDPRLLSAKISILSGGEINRLLLAKILIKPGNLLILDEPTNDLDMDTIEILLEILFEYDGTCLIVSHDRDFLNRLVNRTLVFDGKEGIVDVIGGYDDYIKFHTKSQIEIKKSSQLKAQNNPNTKSNRPSKLSYKYQRELQILPQEIELLEQQITQLNQSLSEEDLFANNKEKFDKLATQLTITNQQLEEKINRWIELENMNN
jgi:ATP-binding cassette subfamily F protein uup